jgi:hypothetical protein
VAKGIAEKCHFVINCHCAQKGKKRRNKKYGNKCVIYDGAFSYSRDIAHTRWGFRELRFEDGKVTTAYLTPPSEITLNGELVRHEGGSQDEMALI